ncbi:phospholipase D family protein [Rhodococcus globerulus]|uniref:PLD phosphodiesterase domain-containing protein n=1 Tax=Nocardia globerula TaxID=1818 RepID=A0A652YJN7_NOCGL|nr:phospholipase D family protein [Rhodococcus globerulus]NMD63994.1 hypothetical protein [Nocardia globerula]PVX66745.1 hypothetical protein C8E04_4086 [Rhodococcus globerulus]
MLAPDERATLVDQLRPPAGSKLVHLMGTTFTLDLQSALLPALAFAPQSHATDPLAMLASIRICANTIDIFHQAGHIRVPERTNALMAFLEPAVHAVRSRPGTLFHPKIWLAKYVDDEEVVSFRLLVQSRNLTRDNSWDMVVALDGTMGSARNKTNKPLRALLQYLADDATISPLEPTRRGRMHTLADDVRYAEWTAPEGLSDIEFHVFGVPGHKPSPNFEGTRHLAISPFLGDDGFDTAIPGERVIADVISRAEALEQLRPQTLKWFNASYVLNSDAGIPNPESDSANVLGGLHAKAYIVEYNHWARLFIGSANATAAAFNKNVEILVEMTGAKKKFGIDAMLGSSGLGSIISPYEASGGAEPDEADAVRRELDKVLQAIASTPFAATVQPAGEYFDLLIETALPMPLPGGFTATIELTTRPGSAVAMTADQPVDFVSPGLTLVDVMPFLAVRVTEPGGLTGSTVVVANLIDEPDERLDEILASQLKKPEDVLRFIALMLTISNGGDSAGETFDQIVRGQGSQSGPLPGILEALLLALATAPAVLTDMDGFIRRLHRDDARRDLLPPGFSALWTDIHSAATVLNGRNS